MRAVKPFAASRIATLKLASRRSSGHWSNTCRLARLSPRPCDTAHHLSPFTIGCASCGAALAARFCPSRAVPRYECTSGATRRRTIHFRTARGTSCSPRGASRRTFLCEPCDRGVEHFTAKRSGFQRWRSRWALDTKDYQPTRPGCAHPHWTGCLRPLAVRTKSVRSSCAEPVAGRCSVAEQRRIQLKDLRRLTSDEALVPPARPGGSFRARELRGRARALG
jgi:hypothetical protein